MSINTFEKRASATNYFLTTVMPSPDGVIGPADRIQVGGEYSGIPASVVEYPTTTIRERIIRAIMTRLADITTANGYNTNAGNLVLRAKKLVDPAYLPFLNVWPQKEEEILKDYGNMNCVMPVRIEAIIEYDAENPSAVCSKVMGDVIENLTGIKYILPFSLGSIEIETGNTVIGSISGATCYVGNVNVMEGTWSGGDAAGQLTVSRVTGEFQTENLKVGDDTVAYTEWAIYGTSAIENSSDSLADMIDCIEAGTNNFPSDTNLAVGAVAIFNVTYNQDFGNPYNN